MAVDKRLAPTSGDARTRAAVWFTLLAGTTMAIGVIAVWYVINDRAREHIDSTTDYATHINQLLIRQDIDNRHDAALQRDRARQRRGPYRGSRRGSGEFNAGCRQSKACERCSNRPGEVGERYQFAVMSWPQCTGHNYSDFVEEGRSL